MYNIIKYIIDDEKIIKNKSLILSNKINSFQDWAFRSKFKINIAMIIDAKNDFKNTFNKLLLILNIFVLTAFLKS